MSNFYDRHGTTFTVKRKTITAGAAVSATWLNVSTTNKGVLSDLSGYMIKKYERKYAESTHLLLCGVIDVEEGDHIVYNSSEYEVSFVSNPAQKDHHLEVELKLYV